MNNANLNRSLKRTYYRLSQRYGVQGNISRRTSADTDFVTGETKQTVETRSIRKLVRVAVAGDSREVIYTAAMMQSLRPFAWQGGQGQDTKNAIFLVFDNELRGWEVTPEQWLRYDRENYQVVSALKNDGGWIIEAKLAVGSEDGILVTVSDDLGVSQETSNSIGTSDGTLDEIVVQLVALSESATQTIDAAPPSGVGAMTIETTFIVS